MTKEMSVDIAVVQLAKVLAVLTKEKLIRWQLIGGSDMRCDLLLLLENQKLRIPKVTRLDSRTAREDVYVYCEEVRDLCRRANEQFYPDAARPVSVATQPAPVNIPIVKLATYYVKNTKTGEYLRSTQKPWAWTKDRKRAITLPLQTAIALMRQLPRPDSPAKPPAESIDAALEPT